MRRRSGSALGAALWLAFPLCSTAWSQTSPWHVGLPQAIVVESNLLRLTEGRPAPAGLSRSDRVATTSLRGGLDLALGRQRAYGTLVLREHRYERNERYDHGSHALDAGIEWASVARLSGALTVSRRRARAAVAAERFHAPRCRASFVGRALSQRRLAAGRCLRCRSIQQRRHQ